MSSSTTPKTIMHEVMQLNRKGVFDDQATIELDEENVMNLKITLTPTRGLFAGTSIPFEFEFSDSYPATAPSPSCKAVVYHSNIGEDGGVCLNMFSEPDPSYRIEHYINGLLWLLDNQNFNSQLNGYVTHNRRLFNINFQLSLLGEEVNGLHCTQLKHNPTKAELRGLVSQIFSLYPSLKALKGKGLSELASCFSEKAHFRFVSKNIPFLARLSTSPTTFSGTFATVDSVCTQVDVRARKLSASPDEFLKEMIIRVDDQLALLVTNGNATIDTEALAKELGKTVTIPKAGDLKRENATNVLEVSLFDWQGPILLDRTLVPPQEEEEGAEIKSFYGSTGYPRLLVKAPVQDFLNLREEQPASLTHVTLVKIAKPIPAPAEAGAIPTSSTEPVATEKAEPPKDEQPTAKAEPTTTPAAAAGAAEATAPGEPALKELASPSPPAETQSLEDKAGAGIKKEKLAALALDPIAPARTLSEDAAAVIS